MFGTGVFSRRQLNRIRRPLDVARLTTTFETRLFSCMLSLGSDPLPPSGNIVFGFSTRAVLAFAFVNALNLVLVAAAQPTIKARCERAPTNQQLYAR